MVALCYLSEREMKATHDLGLVKGLMKDGGWNVTVTALDTAVELGFDE